MELREGASALAIAGLAGSLTLLLTMSFAPGALTLVLLCGSLAADYVGGTAWAVLFFRRFWNEPPFWRRNDGLAAIALLLAVPLSLFVGLMLTLRLPNLG